MKPGRERPGYSASATWPPARRWPFNEAGARTPRISTGRAPTRSASRSFNEAGARTPRILPWGDGTETRLILPSMKPGRERPGYNAAGVIGALICRPSMKPGRERPGYGAVEGVVEGDEVPSMKPGRERPGYPRSRRPKRVPRNTFNEAGARTPRISRPHAPGTGRLHDLQ